MPYLRRPNSYFSRCRFKLQIISTPFTLQRARKHIWLLRILQQNISDLYRRRNKWSRSFVPLSRRTDRSAHSFRFSQCSLIFWTDCLLLKHFVSYTHICTLDKWSNYRELIRFYRHIWQTIVVWLRLRVIYLTSKTIFTSSYCREPSRGTFSARLGIFPVPSISVKLPAQWV